MTEPATSAACADIATFHAGDSCCDVNVMDFHFVSEMVSERRARRGYNAIMS